MEISAFRNISSEQDTVGKLKSTLLVPASRINSEEGVILPKEAVTMVPLEPANITRPVIENEESCICCYLLIPLALIAAFFAVKYFKIRKSS
nr:hypothetical protein [uncultured Draconibacterium sp.]